VEMCREVGVFRIPKKIINATKVILKYLKTQKTISEFWNSQCVSQAGIVFERIVVWTIYGLEITKQTMI